MNWLTKLSLIFRLSSYHVWIYCPNLLCIFRNVVRSCMSLLIKHSLNIQVFSGHVWTFCWKFFEYSGVCQVMYEPVVKISLHIPQLSFLQQDCYPQWVSTLIFFVFCGSPLPYGSITSHRYLFHSASIIKHPVRVYLMSDHIHSKPNKKESFIHS